MKEEEAINSLISMRRALGYNITKKTIDKIEKIKGIVLNTGKYKKYNKKYAELSNWLSKNDKYIILIQFLLLSDKLKIHKNFKNSNGEHYFNLSIDMFSKQYKVGRATFNRTINLFVLLGLIGKDNPYEQNYRYTMNQENIQASKVIETKKALRVERNTEIITDKITYKFENLYYNVDYTAKLLRNAEETAKKLTAINFKTSAISSIYFNRILGAEKTSKVFYGADFIEETKYSQFLSEAIEEAIISQIEQKGYARKATIFIEIRSKIVAHIQNEPKRRKGRDRNTAKAVFEREYKRSIDFIIAKYNFVYMRRPTKEVKEVFKLKKDSSIIYDKNFFERKKEEQ